MEMVTERAEAAAWFHALRDRIVAAFEALEDRAAGDMAPGRFEVSPTQRGEGGGAAVAQGGDGATRILAQVTQQVGPPTAEPGHGDANGGGHGALCPFTGGGGVSRSSRRTDSSR